MTQGQFLSRLEVVCVQSFPSPRLVGKLNIRNRIGPTNNGYLGRGKRWIHAFSMNLSVM